jgi:hypothetical protein
MNAARWSDGDLALVAVCIVTGVLALGFFISIFIADAKDAKRRSDKKKALRRARKHFTGS